MRDRASGFGSPPSGDAEISKAIPEDAARALGAEWQGRRPGPDGNLAARSVNRDLRATPNYAKLDREKGETLSSEAGKDKSRPSESAAPSAGDDGSSYVQRYLLATGLATDRALEAGPATSSPEDAAGKEPPAADPAPAVQPAALHVASAEDARPPAGEAAKVEPAAKPKPLDSEEPPRALLGFHREVTRRRFQEVREIYEALRRERDELESRCAELEQTISKHEEIERLVKETLLSARRDAHSIREGARSEAEAALTAARKKAQQLLDESRREADELRAKIVAAAERERDAILVEAKRTQQFIDETEQGLAEFLTSALKWYERGKRPAEDPAAKPTSGPARTA